jgi:hypothetical protein
LTLIVTSPAVVTPSSGQFTNQGAGPMMQ